MTETEHTVDVHILKESFKSQEAFVPFDVITGDIFVNPKI
jgi:hypothetical protein